MAAGALDAWLTPTVMKRGRPAIALSVLCRPAEALALTTLIFELTPTLGVRRRYTERTALEREWLTVAVAGQPIQVKLGVLAGRGRWPQRVAELLPQVPFNWVEFNVGQMGVFVIDRADLVAHADAIRAAGRR